MTRFKIIINPLADKGITKDLVPDIRRELDKYNLDYDLVCTEYPWHAAEITQSAIQEGFDAVVAGGGDGTSNEVLNGIMLAQESGSGSAVMGVLPIGRGNDFNYANGNPADWIESCRVFANGSRQKIDVGFVTGGLYPQGRYFGNQVGVGFDSVAGFIAAKQRLSGFPGYLLAALRTIYVYSPAPIVEIVMDDETLTLPALMVTVMNGKRSGGGFMIAPDGKIDDGLFDVCIAHELSRVRILPLLIKFMRGTQYAHPAVQARQVKKISIRAVKGTLPVHADGETIATECTEVNITILPQQIELFVSAEGAAL